VAIAEVKAAITAKFTQNPELQKYLLATKDLCLAQGSNDKNWGTGLKPKDPLNMDPNLWQGHNWLGEIFMSVRQDMS
jgi:ribA/ribD-fused uncharacterized protein